MSLLQRALHRGPVEYEEFLFLWTVKTILDTPIVSVGSMPFRLVSMVQHRDVLPYLLALKSFTRYLNPHKILVVCDPTITAGDRDMLRQQVPHIDLRDASEFVHHDIPRGGCWERLFAITEYARQDYVVQLDADTVTIARPIEVEQAINQMRGFVLGEAVNQTILPVETVSANAALRAQPGAHIQHQSEAALSSMGFGSGTRYVRGCAGFTGFQTDTAMQDKVVEFSRRMRERFQERWSAWGTEQVASNFTVANQPGTEVLPFPKYGTPNVTGLGDTFIHFIGSRRFVNGKYRGTAQCVIRELNQKGD